MCDRTFPTGLGPISSLNPDPSDTGPPGSCWHWVVPLWAPQGTLLKLKDKWHGALVLGLGWLHTHSTEMLGSF